MIHSGFQATVVAIPSTSKAIEGFKMMLDREVSGLAVVDETGRLVDNLSLRDLKGIRPDVKGPPHPTCPRSPRPSLLASVEPHLGV